MNCPTCGLRTWHHDNHTLICKKGHKTVLRDDTPEPAVTVLPYRQPILVPALAGLAGAAVLEGVVHLL